MKIWLQIFNLVAIVVLAFSAGYTTNVALAETSTPTAAAIGLGAGAEEQLSPQDWVSEDDIKVYRDRVEIRLNNPIWARFTNTNSMDPVFDIGSNGIEIPVEDPELLMPGDVVTYKSDLAEGTIIHRIVFKGRDDKGTFFILQGDNLANPDPERVYASEGRIEHVLVAIVY